MSISKDTGADETALKGVLDGDRVVPQDQDGKTVLAEDRSATIAAEGEKDKASIERRKVSPLLEEHASTHDSHTSRRKKRGEHWKQ